MEAGRAERPGPRPAGHRLSLASEAPRWNSPRCPIAMETPPGLELLLSISYLPRHICAPAPELVLFIMAWKQPGPDNRQPLPNTSPGLSAPKACRRAQRPRRNHRSGPHHGPALLPLPSAPQTRKRPRPVISSLWAHKSSRKPRLRGLPHCAGFAALTKTPAEPGLTHGQGAASQARGVQSRTTKVTASASPRAGPNTS